jgi:guanylate kinase
MKNEVISFTTRRKRPGEVEGVDYTYITQEKFDNLFNSGGLAEYTTYFGNASYGITMDELIGKLSRGDAFVIVDAFGMEQLKKLYAEHVTVFIRTDPREAVRRMMLRGDSDESIAKRLKTFEEELNSYYLYDYILENTGSLLESLDGMRAILKKEGVL